MSTTRKVLYTVLLLFVALLITAGLLLIFLKPWARKKVDKTLGIPVHDHPNFIQVFTLDGTETKTNDITKYTVNRYTPFSSVIYEYSFKDDVRCTQVNYEDAVFWKYSESPEYGYPKRLTVDTTDKKGSIAFKDHVCYYRFEDSKWNHHFTARDDHLIDLDIDKKQFTESYFLKKEGQYTKYTPDFGCAFKSVKCGGEVLWKTDNPNAASPGVLVNDLPDGSRSVIVRIINGSNQVFMVKPN